MVKTRSAKEAWWQRCGLRPCVQEVTCVPDYCSHLSLLLTSLFPTSSPTPAGLASSWAFPCTGFGASEVGSGLVEPNEPSCIKGSGARWARWAQRHLLGGAPGQTPALSRPPAPTPARRRPRPYSTRPRPSPCSTHHHGPAPWSADRPPAETGNFFLTLRGVLSRYTKSQNRPTRKCSF